MRAIHLPKLIVENRTVTRNGQPAPFGHRQVSDAHRDKSGALGRLIGLIGSTTNAASAAGAVADHLAMLVTCGTAIVYLWDADRARLVRSASTPERTDSDTEEYALGEGVVGRAALRAERPVSGSLRAERTSRNTVGHDCAAVGVRVAARDDRLLGVVALVADGPGTLAPETVRAVTDAARLFALVLERESLATTARLDEDLLGSIELLAAAASPEVPLCDVLESLAALGLKALRVNACAIFASERDGGSARLAAVSPRDAELPPTWQREVAAEEVGRSNGSAIERTSDSAGNKTMLVPAMLGRERFGTLAVADHPHRSFSVGDQALAERLARVVALAVRQRRLAQVSYERTKAEDLLWDALGQGSGDAAALLARAQRLGCDLEEQRIVIVASALERSGSGDLRGMLQGLDRSALCDVSNGRLTAIAVESAATGLAAVGWSVGVSQPCAGLARYPVAYRQAQEAHDLGRKLFGAGRVVRYEDLGGYRFVPALVDRGLANEVEYQQISRLPDELLRTLEAYLDSGGNTAQAASLLFLHRNTLRQRLDRISTLLDLDLTTPSRWLSLQLVIKTARLKRLTGVSATGAAPQEGP